MGKIDDDKWGLKPVVKEPVKPISIIPETPSRGIAPPKVPAQISKPQIQPATPTPPSPPPQAPKIVTPPKQDV